MIAQEFNLNLIPQQAPVVVHVSQYDIGEGRLIAHLYEGDTPYTPQAGATATIQGTKPDRIGFQYDDVVLSGSIATANLTEQMCAVAGRTVVNLIITESDNRTGTFNFVLDVQPAALADDAIISRSDGSILDIPDLVERAESAAESVEEYTEESEAWARGTKGGQAVSSTDPTYHNNSKYYAEQSGDYVKDAEAWANGTRNGTAVGASDPTYHKNSKYFAEQSDDSAEDAEAYAVGTRDGSSVSPTDPTYRNNAKFYAEQAADIVDTGNFVVAVDPTTIQTPTAPYLRPSDVVNNLNSTEIDKPLSAYQGKVLKDTMLDSSDIINNLTSTATDKALSAAQGKELKDSLEVFRAYANVDVYYGGTQGVTISANGWGFANIQLPSSLADKEILLFQLHNLQEEAAYSLILATFVPFASSPGEYELTLYNTKHSNVTITALRLLILYKNA